ncbi:MAG: response regulator, partial [Actinomycetota bacterium]
TFWFELPLPEAQPPARVASAPATAANGRSYQVLLAEDNPVNQKLVAAYFHRRGHTVKVVGDGQAAVDCLAAGEHFDVVLMDMQMPVMDGLEATRAIRALAPPAGNVPIVAITANAFPEDAQRCLDAGMNEFASKPVDFEMLIRLLERIVPSPAAPDSPY